MKTTRNSQRRETGFTHVDLLAIVGVLVLSSMFILPALARTGGNSETAQCLNNLRQLSTAINMYTVDNSDTLPGPSWTGVYSHYDTGVYMRFGLIRLLTPFLGSAAATSKLQKVQVADCPGSLRYRKYPPSSTHVLATNVSYQSVRFITNNFASPPSDLCVASVQDRFPFGYPSKSMAVVICGGSSFDYPGMMISNIKYPTRSVGMMDADQLNSFSSTSPGTSNYGQNLPSSRVHLNTRNYLFLDGHAANVRD